MDVQAALQSEVEDRAKAVVFRRIRGRIVPIRQKPEKKQAPLARTTLNVARSGSFGVGIGGAVYGAGTYAKKRIDFKIGGINDGIFNLKGKLGKKPVFKLSRPDKWADDATPLANLSKKMFADQMKAYDNSFSSHIRKLDSWHESMRQLGNLRTQSKTLKKYSNYIAKNIGKTSVKAGIAAGALSLTYLTGSQLYDSFKGKK